MIPTTEDRAGHPKSSSPAHPPDPERSSPEEIRDKRLRGGTPAVALLVLLSALAWRLMGLQGLEVWRDEALTIIDAKAGWRDLLFRLPFAEDTPPLAFVFYKVWLSLVPGELSARFPSVLAGVAAVGVLMWTAYRIAPRAWWATGLLAGFSYELLVYSQEIRVYALLALVTSLALFLAEEAVSRQHSLRSRVLLCLMAVLAAHLHAVGLFVAPMIAGYLLVRAGFRETWRVLWFWPVLFWTAAVSPMVWFSVHWSRYHQQMGNWWNIPPDRTAVEVLSRHFFGLMPVRLWGNSGDWHLDAWGAFCLERLVILGTVVLLVSALLDRRTRRPAAGLLAAAIVYYGLLGLTSYLALPNVVERTALPGWCPIVLVMGLGAASGARAAVHWFKGCAVLTIAAVWACSWMWMVYMGPARHDPNRAAFSWMRAQVGQQDLVFSWQHGFEDLTVYRLEGLVDAEQLLSREFPVYAGRPPQPLLIARAPDPKWADRLERTIRSKQQNGEYFRIWMIRKGFAIDNAEPGSPEAIIERTHSRGGRFIYADLRGTSITEYLPKPIASKPSASAPS